MKAAIVQCVAGILEKSILGYEHEEHLNDDFVEKLIIEPKFFLAESNLFTWSIRGKSIMKPELLLAECNFFTWNKITGFIDDQVYKSKVCGPMLGQILNSEAIRSILGNHIRDSWDINVIDVTRITWCCTSNSGNDWRGEIILVMLGFLEISTEHWTI